MVGDEGTHFFKSYDISEGHLFPNNINAQFPKNVIKVMDKFTYLQVYPDDRVNIKDIKNLLSLPLNPNTKISIDISHVVIYPPIPYLASALIISIIKFFNSSPLIMLYLGRLANLLVWILLVYLAIKITPVNKWIFLLLALMPRTLTQAASFSADSLTFGLSFLTIAIFLNISLNDNKKIDVKDIIILLFLILALILSKQGYAILILLFFTIPAFKFKNNKKRALTFAFISIPPIIIVSIWNILFKNLYRTNAADLMNGQIAFILSDPLNFMVVILNTLVLYSKYYFLTFVGGIVEFPLLNIMIFIYIAILIFVSLIDVNKIKINLKQKLIYLLIFSIISIMAFLFEYITFTALGSHYIFGIQGRYFIPIAPLIFLVLYNNRILEIINKKMNLESNKFYLFIIFFIILILSYSIYLTIYRFYV